MEDTADDTYGFKDDALNIADDSNDYTYDANGNMISDTNKGITNIRYNHLNLPTEIVFDNDLNQKISYVYTAEGVKLQKIVNDHGSITTTDYAGDYIYENGTLKFINHAEGYLQPDGAGGFEYVYQYKDHLGNVRLSYSDTNGDGVVDVNEIIEENNYYPFGLKHKGYNNVVSGTHYPYGFNGKEENEELGLQWLDFGARNYDATLGRWMNLDPLAEQMRKHSPYNYAFNNPIINVDEAGKFVLPAHVLNNPKYKRLVSYVKNGIQGVLNNKKVVNALKKYGGFTDKQLKEGLTYGSGPEINVKQLGLKYGEPINGSFDSQEPSILNIDVDIVEALEKAEGLDRDTWLFILSSTILHEYVHYGDEQDGEETPGEEGIAFELEAYGINVGQNEFNKAKDFIKQWLEEQRQKREEARKKTVGFNTLINNYDSLESGTYEWDGESWIKTD